MNIAELLTYSIHKNASDLHLSAGLPPRIRVDGDIIPINMPAIENQALSIMMTGIMNDRQRDDYEKYQATDFCFELPDVATHRFRANVFKQRRGIAAAFRNIPTAILSLDELQAPPLLKELCRKKSGIILITGPAGSGKSTTLAAMIDYINKHSYSHIITVEDPIEFVHSSQKSLINQREVCDGKQFGTILSSVMREDPDIILIGEMRDLDSIRLALSAAETGHLVFSTLHTMSAAKTISRIVDLFPAAEKGLIQVMLAESLQAVVSQTLLKKIGGGRIAAHEIMIATSAIRSLVSQMKVAQMYSAIQTGRKEGMQTLDHILQNYVEAGYITLETAHAKMTHK